jgi:Cytochrome c552
VARLLVVLASILSLAAVWIGLASSETPPGPRLAASNRPIQQNEDGYVSSDTCRACHPSEYAAWHASYHRSMTQVASPETVRANFDAVQVDAVHGRPMRLTRDGVRFYAEFDDPDWNGAGGPLAARGVPAASAGPLQGEAPRISREVVMITGSHHQQIYWYATGRDRLLGQLPGAYLIAEQRWIPRRAAVLHPPSDAVFSETGHWNAVCIACHTTSGKPEFDTPFGSQPLETQAVQTRVAEFGISCEACHGPSEAHIEANRNPLRRYQLHLTGAPESTTTQPTRLAGRVSSQVCGQCHGIWEFASAADERQANSRGLPYRPGDELTATRLVAQPTRNAEDPAMRRLVAEDPGFISDAFWPDGMVRVSGREYNGLIESPCFTHATDEARKLSCFSCHTMHRTPDDARSDREWANDQLGPDKADNRACAACHPALTASDESVSKHTGHAAGSSGSACYNCHMPYTTYGLLKTIRSHTVSSPSVRESVESGRPNACNLCHLDKPLSWTEAALDARTGQRRDAPSTIAGDESQVSAAVLWALKGDAGQRAIVAQAMGWRPAQDASRTAWMAPVLAQLLDDPYDAVRFIAGRSLRSIQGFEMFPYDFVAPQKDRYRAQLSAMRAWDGAGRGRSMPTAARAAVLLDAEGGLRVPDMLRLVKERNDRPMLLRE